MFPSPVGSSANNGLVDRAIQSVEHQVKIRKGAVDREDWNEALDRTMA